MNRDMFLSGSIVWLLFIVAPMPRTSNGAFFLTFLVVILSAILAEKLCEKFPRKGVEYAVEFDVEDVVYIDD